LSINVYKDKNLEYDPYFYERKQQLQQDIDDIDSEKVKMISSEDFWDDIDNFECVYFKMIFGAGFIIGKILFEIAWLGACFSKWR